jgi:hypothetical protein
MDTAPGRSIKRRYVHEDLKQIRKDDHGPHIHLNARNWHLHIVKIQNPRKSSNTQWLI